MKPPVGEVLQPPQSFAPLRRNRRRLLPNMVAKLQLDDGPIRAAGRHIIALKTLAMTRKPDRVEPELSWFSGRNEPITNEPEPSRIAMI